MTAEKIHNLKMLLGGLENYSAREFWPAPQLEEGLPKGLIIELSGNARIEWLIHFLCSQPDLRIFWCETKQRVLPLALQQRGLDIDRVTFGVFPKDVVKPIRRVLQSQLYPIIVAPNDIREVRVYQALQLLSEKSNCTLFLLAHKKLSDAWPISMQLEIKKLGPAARKTSAPYTVRIVKQKHRSIK